MKKVRIVVVDDHKLIREMWTRVFNASQEMEIVGESGMLDEAIELIKTKRPDIVFLDINIPPSSGLDAVPLIRKYSPGTKIIAVSMHNQPAYAKKMLKLGARGYVTKNSSHREMLEAVEDVMAGRNYICAEIKDRISEQLLNEDPTDADIRNLSLREIEIIRFIKEGLLSKEIAARLNLSPRTVEVHRHNILRKLKLKNTASLIRYINTTDLSL